ncbi:MAG TPA: hypothetical protein VHB79_29900 [Polyangiaceae bacterium]|nr:hypothetical protein [Polyangiaceae bacterium]
MSAPLLRCAVASMRHGLLLPEHAESDAAPELEELAATLPEVFGTADPGCLERVAARLGAEQGGGNFSQVLFLSDSRVHVIQALERRAGEALVAVSPSGRSVGLVLSQVQARAAELEEER